MAKAPKRMTVRRSLPEYDYNPSIEKAANRSSIGRRAKVNGPGTRCIIMPDTGELKHAAPAVLYEIEERDADQFVKIFPGLMTSFLDFSGAATKVFTHVYLELLQNKNSDLITLHFKKTSLGRTTFEKGLTELLAKEVIYKSIFPAQFFINVNYMFNGDRLAIVKEFRLKKTEDHPTLPFDESEELI